MAASSEEDDVATIDQNVCIMCIFPPKSAKVKLFSSKTWCRFLDYVPQWEKLKVDQATIASDFAAKVDIGRPNVRLEIPEQKGFHTVCYQRFTDKQRVKFATARLQKEKETQDSQVAANIDVAASCSSPPPVKKRTLRSSLGTPTNRRSVNVLPNICILCQRDNYITCPTTRKRNKERLIQCSTIQAINLKKAAEDSNNEALLLHIRDKDCVAIEVKYHFSCYRNYTRYITAAPPSEKADTRYTSAFDIFCESVITRQIIEKKAIFRLKQLNCLFIKQVKATHDLDVPSYKSWNLRNRLMNRFPQLCFLKPAMRSQGYIVYVNDISTESLVGETQSLRETVGTSTVLDSSDTTTDDETDMSYIGINEQKTLHESYMAALALRNDVNNIKSTMPWPPTSEDLTIKAAEAIVPSSLYNFLAWTVGASDEPQCDRFVEVPPATHKRILTIAQDIIYLTSKGKKQMPKHMALAMTVRHLSGSAQLIGMLNGFGYCVSNSVTLNHDTAIANKEMRRGEDALPSTIVPDVHTTLVWDNNDFGEETLSGRGTTHNTNGIAIQRPSQAAPDTALPIESTKRTRERTMQPPPMDIATYYGGKKEGPKPFAADVSLKIMTALQVIQSPMKLDLAYNITKFQIGSHLPAWTGYNQLQSLIEVPARSVIGYLPVIDASPTDMSTVLTILQRSVKIADKLNLETIVIVMDQAIYSKAEIIRWGNAEFMKRLVVRLGAFHTAMSYIGCIGKRFRDAGLQDILIESETVAVGSINGVMNGKHYNRAVRSHKLLAEALQWMRLDAYMETLADREADVASRLMADLNSSFPEPQVYSELVNSDRFKEFDVSYRQFIDTGNLKQTFGLWNSYISMVEILLLFLRGTREANWSLHLASIRCMLPWIFAYDHINYGRYLPAYWLEMSHIQTTHPEIAQKFLDGEFAVQRSDNPYAQTACDQTIEQTANRDSKTKGGMTGFTTSKGAVNRWIWSHHARGAITRECETMAGKGENTSTRTDLLPSRIKRDNDDVERIVATINDMVNPFTYEDDELVNITSGVVATEDVQIGLQTAHEKGDLEFRKFTEERLQTDEVAYFDGMKKLKLKTFTNMTKAVKTKVRGREVTLKADRNLLARLVIIGRFRKIDLRELLSYSLGPVPLCLATSQGGLVKTNKANLLHALEGQSEEPLADIPIRSVSVVDAMAMIQQFNIKALQGEKTFQNLATVILKRLVNRARTSSSNAIHFVTDTYRDMSIKNAEREKRAASGSQLMRVYGQALPQQWKKFLSNGENKKSLVEYLFSTWSTAIGSTLQGVKVYLSHGQQCHVFSALPGSPLNQVVETDEVQALNSTQEEADTRMFLHAAYAATDCDNIIIVSPDTDVFVIAIALRPLIPARLYFHTGRGANLRTINIAAIHSSIGDDVCQALIGLHCFTGCDSVSALYGNGKKKALNMLLKEKDLSSAFKDLGERFEVQPDMEQSIEAFVCKLYGQHNTSSVNEARYNMFRLARKSEITMPPNQDALRHHIKRANYQAAIFKRSLQASPDIPSPDGHGWKVDEDGQLTIDWMSLSPAPDSVMELVNCTSRCKKSRCSDAVICTCLENNIPCTDLCKCARRDCANVAGQMDDYDEEEEDGSDDEE